MQYTVTISLFLYCIVFALLNLALSQQEMQLLQDMRLEFCKKMKQLYFDSILHIIVYNLFLAHFIEKLPLCHLLYIIVLSILVAFILSKVHQYIQKIFHLPNEMRYLLWDWQVPPASFLDLYNVQKTRTPIIWFWANSLKKNILPKALQRALNSCYCFKSKVKYFNCA